ncbi:MAG: Clp protease N-terminal domain-containing protein [bacterium]|nr:Clp protease N-terminal domain-containing protein [bacterium]
MATSAERPGIAQYEQSFSPKTRKVLGIAQNETRKLNHNYLGTEHIMLALIQDEEIAGFLQKHRIFPEKIKLAILFVTGRGEKSREGEIDLTPRAKKIIEFAADEVKLRGDTKITPFDLLRGVLIEGEAVAAGILEDQIGLGNKSIPTLLNELRAFRPTVEKEDDILEAKTRQELTLESAQRLEAFFIDPKNDEATKVRIARIVNELMELAKRTSSVPEEPKSDPSA